MKMAPRHVVAGRRLDEAGRSIGAWAGRAVPPARRGPMSCNERSRDDKERTGRPGQSHFPFTAGLGSGLPVGWNSRAQVPRAQAVIPAEAGRKQEARDFPRLLHKSEDPLFPRSNRKQAPRKSVIPAKAGIQRLS